jgi:hypothetical protein
LISSADGAGGGGAVFVGVAAPSPDAVAAAVVVAAGVVAGATVASAVVAAVVTAVTSRRSAVSRPMTGEEKDGACMGRTSQQTTDVPKTLPHGVVVAQATRTDRGRGGLAGRAAGGAKRLASPPP